MQRLALPRRVVHLLSAAMLLATHAGVCHAQTTAQTEAQTEAPAPTGWPKGAQADPGTFAAFSLAGDGAPFLPAQWPTRVVPQGHTAKWFHAIQTFQPEGLMPNPQRTFAREGQGEVLAMRTMLDAQRFARALGMSEDDLTTKLPDVVPYSVGAFLVSLRSAEPGEELTPRNARSVLAAIRVVSASEKPAAEEGKPASWLIDSTAFLAYPPRGKPAAEARGTVLIMPGLLGTPEGPLLALARVLREEGFVVVQMVAQPARFIERTPMVVREDDVDASVAEIARVLDNRSAECAYAVASALAELERLVPQLAAQPRVAIGFSGGAITLPTVVALEAERYKAAVLVGGGTNFFHMIDTSNYTSFLGGDGPTWPALEGDALKAVKARAYDAFIQHATLDAFHTAKALQHMPSLNIYGTIDEAVPSPLADQLWQRLGERDRETYPVGHELLFAQLGQRNRAIADWIIAALAPAEAPATNPDAKPAPQPAPQPVP